jgi:hypothetical protein
LSEKEAAAAIHMVHPAHELKEKFLSESGRCKERLRAKTMEQTVITWARQASASVPMVRA